MYTYGELPSDLTEMEESLGPPPAWFRPESGITTPEQASAAYYSYPRAYYGLGEREAEIEVNPVEELQDLKFKQEMNKKIPVEARRYTTINPLSPMFRDKKAKFGYGGLGNFNGSGGSSFGFLVYVALAASNAYHGYKRNGDSVGWALGWLLFGFGPIGLVVSLIQGWGQPSDSTRLQQIEAKIGTKKKKKKK
jgi:hypothetical protein